MSAKKIDWDADEAMLRQLADPDMREAMLRANRRAREQAELLERAAKMKRPSGHTPAVQAVYDVVAANRDMLPAELWDKFGHEPRFIGLTESKFKRRAVEARTELRRSVKAEK